MAATISGLSYRPYFLSAQDQRMLVRNIYKKNWSETKSLKRHRYQEYGWKYHLRKLTRSTSYFGNIPLWLNVITDKCYKQRRRNPIIFDRIEIHDVLPGNGVLPTPGDLYEETIGIVPLVAPICVDFSSPNMTQTHYIRPGSLTLLSGEACREWRYQVKPRKYDSINTTSIKRQRLLFVLLYKVK